MSCIIAGINIYKKHIESLKNDLQSSTIKIKTYVVNDEIELAKGVVRLLKNDPNLQIITFDRDALFLSMYLTKNGVICARVRDEYSSYMTKLHNNATVLCLSARIQGICNVLSCSKEFLAKKWEGSRHKVRTDMLEHMVR